ncbi:unnamed protein product [Macrosiphum euphorbiae]|nr:unnamed protein product [Macrosiphum euphorbiae]
MRLEYSSMPPTVHLITARSKVAPLKSGKTDEVLSVPRLELCGALLLAQTPHRVRTTLAVKIDIQEVHAWTDSTVVLSYRIQDFRDKSVEEDIRIITDLSLALRFYSPQPSGLRVKRHVP